MIWDLASAQELVAYIQQVGGDGLNPADYADLVVQTPDDAKAAIAVYLRDAGITPEPDWQENV